MEKQPEQVEVPVVDPAEQFELQREELTETALEVLRSGRYIGGEQVDALEREVAERCGCDHAVSLNSGTDALQLTLEAAGVGEGDEVILPSFTFFACVEAVVRAGAVPVFVDIEPEHFTLDPDRVKDLVSEQTAAIMAVHLYGQPAEMDRLREIAERDGLFLFEDLAQAIGAEWNGEPAGSLSHAGAISFYPTKNLAACGDAGMVVTDDEQLAERVERISNHGQTDRYHHAEIGTNSRLDTLQAALLRVKLKRLQKITENKREIAAAYQDRLAGLPLQLPGERDGAFHVYHQFTVLVDERDRVHEQLNESGISSMIYYPVPQHRQQALSGVPSRSGTLEHTDEIAERCLSLPIYSELNEAQIDWTCTRLKELVTGG